MTATPTPLRELPAKWRADARELRKNREYAADRTLVGCASELEAALSARDEEGAVTEWRWVDERGRAMTNWKQGEPPPMTAVSDTRGTMCVEVRTIATPPASGEAGAYTQADLNAEYTRGRCDGFDAARVTPPAASGDEWARSLLDTELRKMGLHEDAYHIGCGAEVGPSERAALNAIVAAGRLVSPASFDEAEQFAGQLDAAAAGQSSFHPGELSLLLTTAAALIRRLAAVAPAGMVLVPRELVLSAGTLLQQSVSEIDRREGAALLTHAAPTPPATAGQE